MRLWSRIFSFAEFDPNRTMPDVQAVFWRWVLLGALLVVPLLLAFLHLLYQTVPLIVYMIGAVACLYLPALALVRKPKVTVTNRFEIQLHNPRTVDVSILVGAGCSALVYFALLSFGILSVWR